MASPPGVSVSRDLSQDEKRQTQEELQRQRVEGVFLSPTSLLSPSSLASSDNFFGSDAVGRSTPLAVRAPWATPPVASIDSHFLTSPPLVGAEVSQPTRHESGPTTSDAPTAPYPRASSNSLESDFDLHDLGSAASSTPTPQSGSGSSISGRHGGRKSDVGLWALPPAGGSTALPWDRDSERSVHVEGNIFHLSLWGNAVLPFFSL